MARTRPVRRRRLWLCALPVAALLLLAPVLIPTMLLVASLDPCADATRGQEGGPPPGECADPPTTGRSGGAAWGGHANGRIPPEALCPLSPGSPHRLRCDAAAAFRAMAAAHQAALGGPLLVTDAYRDLAGQHSVAARKPHLAARPGTSVHGWGLAVDLVVGGWRGETFLWLQRNAARFGWRHPPWAQRHGPKPEPWHWEFA